MAGWVKANLAYASVLDKVAPLQAQLDSVLTGLRESAARLAQCERELGELDAEVRFVCWGCGCVGFVWCLKLCWLEGGGRDGGARNQCGLAVMTCNTFPGDCLL